MCHGMVKYCFCDSDRDKPGVELGFSGNWVQCDVCSLWCHLECTNLDKMALEDVAKASYACPACQERRSARKPVFEPLERNPHLRERAERERAKRAALTKPHVPSFALELACHVSGVSVHALMHDPRLVAPYKHMAPRELVSLREFAELEVCSALGV